MEILKERERLRKEAIKEAREWVKRLNFKVTAVLIGSYARGDFNKWSDVDVLLIADFKGNPIERLKTLNAPPGFEAIPLTPKEFSSMLSRKNPLAVEAVSRGIVLRNDLELILRHPKPGTAEAKVKG
ncbi:MAG: nucleotidyltransferase domain-containing protein [Candidatus Nezhaarchaeales archaeon]